MLAKFTYLGYTLIFTWPLIAFLWWRHTDRLRAALRLVGIVTGLVTVYGFFVWPYGLSWGCWAYSEDHILGIRILGTVFEDLVWWACIGFLFASFVVVTAGLEESGWPIMHTLTVSGFGRILQTQVIVKSRESRVVEVQEASVERRSADQPGEPDAIARARDFGIDITLLIENLKLTPTERLRKAQAMLKSVVAFQAEVRAFRARQGQ